MADRNETMADIVAEMRSRGCEITGVLVPDDGGRMRAMTPELADRIEAAHDREVQDALDTGGLLGTSHRAKTDGVALVPARIALNLCRAIGERDRQKQEAFVRELADWLSANGHDDLGGYALAQIGAIPFWVPM